MGVRIQTAVSFRVEYEYQKLYEQFTAKHKLQLTREETWPSVVNPLSRFREDGFGRSLRAMKKLSASLAKRNCCVPIEE